MPGPERIDGLLVTSRVNLPDGSAIVVLAPGPGGARRANLVLVGADSGVVWRVEPPTKDASDAWVAVRETAGDIYASTWSCHVVRVDPVTGSAVSTSFTK